MSSLCDDKSLREFWVKCTDQHQLYINPDRLLSALEQKYGSLIADKHQLDPLIGKPEYAVVCCIGKKVVYNIWD